ncbi:MAG: OmpH family outer membrane protein [Nitrospinaceae bacterium]
MIKSRRHGGYWSWAGLWLVFCLAGVGWAGPAQAEVRLGFIDMEKAVVGTKEFKRAITRFRTEFSKEKVIIAEREKKIKAMWDDLNKQGFALREGEKKRKQEKFLKAKKTFERYVQDKNEEFGKKEKEITNAILKKMLKVLRGIGKERKYTMILEKKVVFYSDSAADLTELATRTYDRLKK